MPVIREPTDFIPNSADTSQNASREPTQPALTGGETSSEKTSDAGHQSLPVDVHRPRVVSLFCREHEGQEAAAPYSIKPSQMVILFNSL